MAALEQLTRLEAGTALLVGGDKVLRVPQDVADRFQPGDVVVVVEQTGDVLLIPQAQTTSRSPGSISNLPLTLRTKRFGHRSVNRMCWTLNPLRRGVARPHA
jgi:hypothetical protein